jgi:hypothetical protein
MEKNHQHKGEPLIREKLQSAAVSVEDASANYTQPVNLRRHVYVLEAHGEFHAQEAVGCHQEGGQSYQVLARRLYSEWDLFRAKII